MTTFGYQRNPSPMVAPNSTGSFSRRQICRFLAVAALLVASLAVSGAVPSFDIWPAVGLLVLTTSLAPAHGLALAIFIAPFEQFFGIGIDRFHLLQGICWSFLAVRLAIMVKSTELGLLTKSPSILFLGIFVVLILTRNATPFGSRYYLLDVGFVGTIFVIAATANV